MLPGFFKILINPEKDYLTLPKAWIDKCYGTDVPLGPVTIRLEKMTTCNLDIQNMGSKYVFSGGFGWKKLLTVLGLKDVSFIFFEPRSKTSFHMTYETKILDNANSIIQTLCDKGSYKLFIGDRFAENLLQQQLISDQVKLLVGHFYWMASVSVEDGKFLLCDGVRQLMRDCGIGLSCLICDALRVLLKSIKYNPGNFYDPVTCET